MVSVDAWGLSVVGPNSQKALQVGSDMGATRRAIVELLATGPKSGPEIADELAISRNAVWKHITALRDQGFEIEGRPDGYHVTEVPEFGGDAVAFGLDTPYTIQYEPTLASTNHRARELAADGMTDVVVLADQQTGGRGRLDRTWASPTGGIWLSILISPDRPPADMSLFTFAAAIAIVDTVAEHGVTAGIKWPNDVLAGPEEHKLAGILTELEGEADRVSWVIIGIGLNANIDPEVLPAESTSLQSLIGTVNRRSVTQAVLHRFEELRAAPEQILPAWRKRAYTLGREVRVDTYAETIYGRAVDIEPPGALIIETETGTRRVTTGDCQHLRAIQDEN